MGPTLVAKLGRRSDFDMDEAIQYCSTSTPVKATEKLTVLDESLSWLVYNIGARRPALAEDSHTPVLRCTSVVPLSSPSKAATEYAARA
jgi:hypothetical protein